MTVGEMIALLQTMDANLPDASIGDTLSKAAAFFGTIFLFGVLIALGIRKRDR